MPGTNDYLPFGTGGGANVLAQATYSALAARTAGFSSGVAVSNQLNKAWRQSSVMAAVLGQIIANSGANAVDDGNVSVLVAQLLAALQTELAVQTPIGSIVAWPVGGAPPVGWLECNGSTQNRSGTTAALFAILSTTYGGGAGDGLTFSIPDLRGQFVRGWDHSRGIDSGRAITTPQSFATAIPQTVLANHLSHEAGVTSLINATNPSVIGFARAAKSGENVTTVGIDASEGFGPGETDCLNVTAGDIETRPVNIAMMFIIRYA